MRGPIKTNGGTMGLGLALGTLITALLHALFQKQGLTLYPGVEGAIGALCTWALAAKTGPKNED